MSWELAEKIREETMSDVTRRMAKSEAQVKATPSKAAMELALELSNQFYAGYTVEKNAEWFAREIQRKLADLLEKARDVAENPAYADKQHRLWLALEPWKPK